MVPEIEKPRITEIQVRIDCHGCVQKIKKSLHGIHGIYDVQIDAQQQKLTIVGWADPEKIIKAIKKTRKVATICSHIEPPAEPEPSTTTPASKGDPPAADTKNPPSTETPPAESTPPQAEPSKDSPAPPENAPKDDTPTASPPPKEATTASNPAEAKAAKPQEPKDAGEIHVVYYHPQWTNYTNGHGFLYDGPHYIASHCYKNYRALPHVVGYVENGHQQYHSKTDHHTEDEYHGQNRRDGNNVTTIFSDENPNACTIM